MATIKDVAKYCEISVATVSRVLNNDKKVKESTRKKVQNAIEELNYVPNAIAKNLRTEKSRRVLVLLGGISNQFYSKVITGMARCAEENGYMTTIGITHNKKEIEKEYYENLKMKFYDGVIFMSSELSKEYLNEIDKNYPIISCSEYVKGANITYVGVDNEKAQYDVTQYYIDRDIKDIAFIGTNLNYGSGAEREEGYKKALNKNKIKVCKEYIYRGNYSYQSGENAVKYFMSLNKMPKAILAISDMMAIGAVKELIKNGYNVGKDIKVCGFDNTKISEVYNPTLTTVGQPRFQIGYTAMDLLIKKIEKKIQIKDVKLKHELIIRET